MPLMCEKCGGIIAATSDELAQSDYSQSKWCLCQPEPKRELLKCNFKEPAEEVIYCNLMSCFCSGESNCVLYQIYKKLCGGADA